MGNKGQSVCIEHQCIGSTHAASLDGPWERPAQPVLSGRPNWEGGMVANPAVVVLPNGTLLMAYRGKDDRGIGMATAASWDQPFTRLNGGNAVLGPASAAKTAVDEDMTMWLGPRGVLQMIMHQEGLGSAVASHAYSTDLGLSWTVAGDAYTLTVATTDGNRTYARRERPQMLKSAAGIPEYMFNGVADPDTGFTHTIAVPLGPHAV